MTRSYLKTSVDAQGRIVLVPLEDAGRTADQQTWLKDVDGLVLSIVQDDEGRIHVRTAADEQEELGWLALAQSSMEFWDNPVDDAVWNNA